MRKTASLTGPIRTPAANQPAHLPYATGPNTCDQQAWGIAMFNWSSIMKFAEVNGQRQEAQPRLSGNCPGCGSPMVARCGTKKVWHWAHRGERTCDVWWENETKWHRTWKNQFPVQWQEIVHRAENGEKHIADVKTANGWVLEFQHSPIKPEERQARNDFYRRLIWVVDGTRRKSDKAKFIKVLQKGIRIYPKFQVFSVFSAECALLQEWGRNHHPVFFDFGESESMLWCVHPAIHNGRTYVAPFSRSNFVALHRGEVVHATDGFETSLQAFNEIVSGYIKHAQATRMQPPLSQLRTPRPLIGFERYLTHRRRFRRL
jgi:hypothetical protein